MMTTLLTKCLSYKILILPRWRWEVHYTDSSILRQYDPDGTHHHFSEIDQTRIGSIHLVSDNKPPLILNWGPNRELILFSRNTITTSNVITNWIVGYKQGNKTTAYVIRDNDSYIDIDDINLITVS